jgi:hypothetical protein
MGEREGTLRDRALRRTQAATLGGVAGALGLTGAFSTAAALTFSGKPASAPHHPAPDVPAAAAPEQQAPPAPLVVVHVVHHASRGGGTVYAAAPAPPNRAPQAMPAAPPPPLPACVSTPSHPC